jgi:hypothetical protein
MTQRNLSSDDAVRARRAALLYQYVRDRYERFCGRLKDRHYRLPARYAVDDRPGPEDDPRSSVWVRILGACRSRGIDTDSYMWWASDLNRLSFRDPPEPIALLRPALLSAFLADQPAQRQEVLFEYGFQREELRRCHFQYHHTYGYPEVPAMLMALASEQSQLSMLFRYCMARDFGRSNPDFERVVAATGVGAALLYQSRRLHYDATWSEIIPADFPAVSARLQDQMIGMGRRAAASPRPRRNTP